MSSKSKKRNMKIRSIAKEWIQSIGIAIFTTLFITTFVFNAAEVKGDSMSPTLEEGDRLIIKKYEVVLETEDYKRGDIIVFESPLENDDKYYIKRVIGLPGDKITISNGRLNINDIEIEEPYISKDAFTESLAFGDNYIVSENELFVMVDNRLPGKSNDSRSFGSVSLETIKGKIVFRFLPIDKIDSDL